MNSPHNWCIASCKENLTQFQYEACFRRNFLQFSIITAIHLLCGCPSAQQTSLRPNLWGKNHLNMIFLINSLSQQTRDLEVLGNLLKLYLFATNTNERESHRKSRGKRAKRERREWLFIAIFERFSVWKSQCSRENFPVLTISVIVMKFHLEENLEPSFSILNHYWLKWHFRLPISNEKIVKIPRELLEPRGNERKLTVEEKNWFLETSNTY